ncbi:MAG: M20 metallopeptidase family protein [Peptostreptococcaceae bacterium]
MKITKKQILERASELNQEVVQHRRYFHKNAETHTELPLTTAYVKEKLKEMGYEPKDCSQGGIVAIVGGKKSGKVFLIRGDMDALPITEETDLEFKATNGKMHACGHDMHTSMLLGAAKILKENENNIEGTVKLMFQPGEETLAGAKAMIANGILENPKVDAGMMIHVVPGTPLPTGSVVVPNPGIGSSASDWFEIHIQGKGGHGAMPETTVDPINVACHIHTAIQAINSREIGVGNASVFTIGKIQAGSTSNIIPDTSQMDGTIRTFSQQMRKFIPQRMEEISKYTAKAFRAEAEFKYIEGCPSIINDKNLINHAQVSLIDLLGKEKVFNMDDIMPGGKMPGSEDFGYVSECIPTIMLGLAAGTPNEGCAYPQHHPKACFNEDALVYGMATYAYLAIKWLEDNK